MMIPVFQSSADFASGLVPLPPVRPQPIDDDRLAVEIEILRRRQLRRPDVRELLIRRAERKGAR